MALYSLRPFAKLTSHSTLRSLGGCVISLVATLLLPIGAHSFRGRLPSRDPEAIPLHTRFLQWEARAKKWGQKNEKKEQPASDLEPRFSSRSRRLGVPFKRDRRRSLAKALSRKEQM